MADLFTDVHISSPYAIYESVLSLLQDHLAGFAVGRGAAIGTAPYFVLHAWTGGISDGSIGDPDSEIELPLLLRAVSRHHYQAQWMQSEGRHVLLTQEVIVPGHRVIRTWLDQPGGVRRDDTLGEAEGQLFYTTDVFSLHAVPE